jgi:hypothetical protein
MEDLGRRGGGRIRPFELLTEVDRHQSSSQGGRTGQRPASLGLSISFVRNGASLSGTARGGRQPHVPYREVQRSRGEHGDPPA